MMAGCRAQRSQVTETAVRTDAVSVEALTSLSASELTHRVTEYEVIVMAADSVGDLRVVSREKTITRETETKVAHADTMLSVDSMKSENENITSTKTETKTRHSSWLWWLVPSVFVAVAISILIWKRN